MERKKQNRGITLIALVVTIAVLLILAGISIATLTGEKGIINQSQSAKEQTEISNEKEIVETATIQAMGKNKYGNIEKAQVEKAINSNIGEGKTEVTEDGENIIVNFIESNRYYEIDINGNIEKIEVVKDNNPGDITIGINGEKLDGSEEKPYEIWCIEDLVEWSENYKNYQNSNIILGKTLNFKSNYSYSSGKMLGCNSIEELKDLLTNTSGSGFSPIQNFSGIFDGQKNEIQNIYINKTENAGLFKLLSGATIENFGISGTIIGTKYAGGILGLSNGEVYIKNCYNKANIMTEINDTSTCSGGICGTLRGTITIINSYNAEKVEIIGNTSGGILGATANSYALPYIYNSYNLGDINGSTVGGIIGYVYDYAECINVYSVGNMTGSTIGGIIGSALYNNTTKNKFENCYFLKSDTVQQSAGRNITVNAIMLDKLTNTTIDELNNYRYDNSSLTIEWKKWTLGSNGYPIFE